MSRVPGTFKNKPDRPVRDFSVEGIRAGERLVRIGALVAERWLLGDCSILCAREPLGGDYRWHVSIAHPDRYPTWDEIKAAVYGISLISLAPGRTFAQLLGDPRATAQGWVNVHDNCFHLYEIDSPFEDEAAA